MRQHSASSVQAERGCWQGVFDKALAEKAACEESSPDLWTGYPHSPPGSQLWLGHEILCGANAAFLYEKWEQFHYAVWSDGKQRPFGLAS